jgi:hypothetical protein
LCAVLVLLHLEPLAREHGREHRLLLPAQGRSGGLEPATTHVQLDGGRKMDRCNLDLVLFEPAALRFKLCLKLCDAHYLRLHRLVDILHLLLDVLHDFVCAFFALFSSFFSFFF